ncbi:MAG: DUF4920 domain-containing protein [Ignavibacteriaceae bacterium]|nr:DUF4920 domain-containing protein [Ignavibacteriaceae bacterium]
MKNLLFLLIFLFGVATSYAGDPKKLGKEITLKEKTSVSTILANPKSFVGKKLLVEGTIIEVCQKRGCWVELAGEKPYEKLRVKVKDGEIIFPANSAGTTAMVEGELYEINMSKEEVIEFEKHIAEEQGKKFDASKVTGPRTLYQIRGVGVVLK